MRAGVVGVVLAAIAAVAVSGTPAGGQEPARGDATGALIAEMRALRGAIEQLVSAGARVQLAVGRLQIQEQRVNTLARQLGDVRRSLADAERETAEREAQLEDLEGVLPVTSDRGERQAIEQQAGQLRALLAAGAASLRKLRVDEADLTALVSSEEGRWAELNQQLDVLDQALRR